MAWALLAQHYGRLNTTTGYVAYIYWICGICHAANVQTEGMVLIFIYYYVRVRTRRTARALRAARSVAPIRAHSNTLSLRHNSLNKDHRRLKPVNPFPCLNPQYRDHIPATPRSTTVITPYLVPLNKHFLGVFPGYGQTGVMCLARLSMAPI